MQPEGSLLFYQELTTGPYIYWVLHSYITNEIQTSENKLNISDIVRKTEEYQKNWT
jgi:hypothetical protein